MGSDGITSGIELLKQQANQAFLRSAAQDEEEKEDETKMAQR